MARVTIEDCLEKVDNRFELVLVAAKRARQMYLGAEPQVDEDNDTIPVTALREVAEGYVSTDILKEGNQSLPYAMPDSNGLADSVSSQDTLAQGEDQDEDQYLENELMQAIRALSVSMEQEESPQTMHEDDDHAPSEEHDTSEASPEASARD